MEQAARNLAQSVDAREDWVEKEEARENMRKASHRAANTQSQQRCRVRKKDVEIRSGARSSDGKVKKVTLNLRIPVHSVTRILEIPAPGKATAHPPG
jgi:hypothetical protein